MNVISILYIGELTDIVFFGQIFFLLKFDVLHVSP